MHGQQAKLEIALNVALRRFDMLAAWWLILKKKEAHVTALVAGR
jgi:hypothetical protein